MQATTKELRLFAFKVGKAEFQRCLDPNMICPNPAIRAHSIQNARALELLADDGHVIGFHLNNRNENRRQLPDINFAKVGKNKATTFTGLCADHDRTLFAPIDNHELNSNDSRQLFLLAYRTVIRQFHAISQGAIRLQYVYLKRLELGFDSENVHTEACDLATKHLMQSYINYLYKMKYDEAYLSGSFDSIKHDVVILEDQHPAVAVSCLLSLDDLMVDDEIIKVSLNVIPISANKTFVAFSYLNRDTPFARVALNRVLHAAGIHQKYEISKLIINSCDNFVIAPSRFNRWSDSKKEIIRKVFLQTLNEADWSYDYPELMLF